MRTTKQLRRDAKHLVRLCRANGTLDQDKVRQVMKLILGSKTRGHLTLASQFERLLRLDRLQHTATIESATPLPPDLRANVQARLVRSYGPEISTTFTESPTLIGGMRIRVGSDVYDGTIKAGLAALEKSF